MVKDNKEKWKPKTDEIQEAVKKKKGQNKNPVS